MKLFLYVFFIIYSINGFSQSILNDPDLKIWLRADSVTEDINGQVSLLHDLSGNNIDFIQNDLNRQPYKSNSFQFANNPVLDFDGTDDFLFNNLIDSINLQDLSVFIVSSGLSQQGNKSGLFCVHSLTSGLFLTRNIGPNQSFKAWKGLEWKSTGANSVLNTGYLPNLYTFKRSIANISKLYLNGIQKSSSSSSSYNSTFTNGIARIGYAYQYNYFKGSIAEIIIFSRTLSDIEQQEVELYLMDKYAPPIDLGPDLNISYGFCEQTLSNSNYYTSYLWSNGSTDSSIVVDSSGQYWVEAIDVFGRVSVDTIEVFYPQYSMPSNLLFCSGDSILWDTGLTGAYNFSWSNLDSTSSIYVSDSGSFYFVVQDSLGCQLNSDTISFVKDEYPSYASLGTDTSFCSGNSIELVSGSSQTVSYLWNNMQTSSSLTIDTSGAYNLYSTNTNGCELFDTINVTIIGDAPNIQISFPDTVCELIDFPISDFSTVSSPALIDSISWDLGNGNYSNLYSDTISYLDSGLFNVSVFLSTNQGCSIDSAFSILVNPIPDFSIENQGICDYDTISFSIINNGNIFLNHYNWNFDDPLSGSNNVDSINTPNHLFSSNGIYNISLIVEDINGCLDTTIQQLEIFPSPIVDFAITEACEGNQIQIDNNSVIDSSYSISGYLWSFGDNTQSVDSVPVKSFDSYGLYSIQLICTADSSLCTDTLVDSITINANPILNWDASVACKNTWTSFSNLSTVPNDSIFQTLWVVNVLDSISSDQMLYQFTTAGDQQIQLQTTSTNSCVTDSVFMINVNDEVDLSYQTNPSVLTTQIAFSCLLNDSSNLTSVLWDFGDGSQSSLFSPIHTYNADLIGDTLAILTSGTNLIGCVDTIMTSVVLSDPRVDLELRQLLLSDNNGFYSIIVEMKNIGSIPISDIDLLVSIPNSNPTKEITGVSLLSNENIYYPLNASPSSYNSSEDLINGYVCLEGISYNDFGVEELIINNNFICESVESDSLNLIGLYPNPVQNNINIVLYVPVESSIDFTIVDLNGRTVHNSMINQQMEKGTYKMAIDVTQLSQGFYYLNISDNRGNLIRTSFIK